MLVILRSEARKDLGFGSIRIKNRSFALLRMTPRVVVLNKVKDLALCHPEERSEEGSRVWFNQNQKQILRVAQDDRPFTPDPSGGETALRMTPRVVVLNKVKDLALCHPEERSEEGSRVWFNQNQNQKQDSFLSSSRSPRNVNPVLQEQSRVLNQGQARS